MLEKEGYRDKMQYLYFASIAHDLKTPVNSILGAN